jgi:branched-chain amino acid transport system permease protein
MDGVSVGSLYALIALGYTMVYGILTFINFAHGDVVMVGAWVALLVAGAAGWGAGDSQPPLYAGPLCLIAAMLACGALGFTIERLAYRPLRHAPRLNVLITAIGVSLLIQNVGQLRFIFGTEPRPVPNLIPQGAAMLAGVRFQALDGVVLLTAFVLMGVLNHIVFRTRAGLAMRAVSHDHRIAALMGVPVDRVISLTFVAGSMLAAVGGFLYAVKYHNAQQPAHMSWVLLGLKAFVAAVIGGIGNIRGAMLGGLLIGVLEQLTRAYQPPGLSDVYVFALLIVVLLVKPTGILGRATVEKV